MAASRRTLRRTSLPSTSTVAMLDVIFILFAFFLAVSQIRKSTVKVELPEVSDAVATGERVDEERPLRIIIHLTADGRFGLDREMFHTREVFFARFRERASEARSAGRPIVGEVVSDRKAESGEMVDLVNFLTKEGVKRLEFLAIERGPEKKR
jgi:biopolymer transport protein ExbD